MVHSSPTCPNTATVEVSAVTVKEFEKPRKLGSGFYRLSCMKGPLRLLWTQHRGKDDGMKNNVAFGEKFFVSLNSLPSFLADTHSLTPCSKFEVWNTT